MENYLVRTPMLKYGGYIYYMFWKVFRECKIMEIYILSSGFFQK